MTSLDPRHPLFEDGRRGLFALRYPELWLTGGMVMVMVVLASVLGAPIVFPAGTSLNFLGLHYSLPVAMPLAWFALVLFARAMGFSDRRDDIEWSQRILRYLSFIISLSIVIWCHLNIKLWIPLLNPSSFDAAYQASDLWLGPLVGGMAWIRAEVAGYVSTVDTWYLFFFIFLFFASFVYHAVFDERNLSRVFLAVLLIEAVGPFCYLIAPAVGPFIYEPSVNQVAHMNQQIMWEAHQDIRRLGTPWLAENGRYYLPAGLAAMPSLHAGAPWIFVHYLYKARSTLLPIASLMFVWILIEAVVAKWHYVVDLPAGIVLAFICIWLSERFHAAE